MKRAENNRIVTSREIGEKIRQRRREMGLSQERLAELLDLTYQQVQRYERGSNRLSIERLQQIAVVMAVPLDFFVATTPVVCADNTASYLAGDETLLLAHYRRIPDHDDRQLVVAVARLAARKNNATDLLQPA